MRTSGYGTHPDHIAGLLAAAGDAVIVLTYAEDRAFAGVSLNRFASVNSTRLDWQGVEVLERSEEFGGDGLREMVRRYGEEGELVVVFWGDQVVPAVALETEAVAAHAEMVVGSCYECWLYFTDGHVLIEFQDGEGFVAARVPN
ncbi:hypothetical protein [Streptomyces cyaneofuscatus]|uniref:Uncharacterized protein n=1 Tax=Streptomyces cyaneofuscatus TaxID=66883 RepID=A0ABZ1EYU3_9ACTN|nr:hypothetical protein [Streptomyces cyaneofuscatus]WSB09272.1 hypothetical protein OG849_19545 [Streptomyces cyaneofuscatus]WSD47192.1 hypothetical protein OG857_15855 [Streptomyces cyaneofuscatus]